MPDLTGHELGRYHLLEKLGEGGMATVYKAYDTRLEREVAVKIIRREAFPPEVIEHMLKRFEREAKAMAKLSHSNIVKVHDYGEHEGSPYIVMELLSGGTLKQRLGKPVQWQKAVSLVEPIARALGYAHSEGILHRDVKPANILITKSGEPILTDFGIAKLLEQEDGHTLTGTGVGVGTPEYMAPEQGLGSKVDGRADIYSLGIVLYEIITGRKPFLADTPLAVLYKQMNDPLPRPAVLVPGLPESVEQMLLKALAKQPDARYKDMGEFASVLKNLEKNDGAQTSSVNPLLEIIQPEFEEHRKKSESYVTSDQISIKESQLKEPSENKNDGHNTRLKKEGKKIQAWKVAAGGIGLIGLLAVILLISGVFKPTIAAKPTRSPTWTRMPATATRTPTERTAKSTFVPIYVTNSSPSYTYKATPNPSSCSPVSAIEHIEKFYSLQEDGESNNSPCEILDWNWCRDFNGITWDNLPDSTVGSSNLTGNYFGIKRTILYFDTSTLPSCSKIKEIILFLHIGYYINNNSNFKVLSMYPQVYEYTVPSLRTINWEALGSVAAINPDTWVEVELSGNDFIWINREGKTGLALVHELDYLNFQPTANNDLIINMAESPYPPYLQITYWEP